MDLFEEVTPEEFAALIASSPCSDVFRREFARFSPRCYEGWDGPDFRVRRGDLALAGDLDDGGFFTLILGDLSVGGLIDLQNPYDKGFDEGGLFVIIGNVSCKYFANEYGKCAFVDGALEAKEAIIAAFEDSALVVTGDLRTRFFYGCDIWAEVGGAARMEYGDGYCLPIGYSAPAREAIRPRNSRESSMRLLDWSAGDDEIMPPTDFLKRIRAGAPIFK
jgi:hypothetical protein